MKKRLSRRGLVLLTLAPLMVGAAMSGVHGDHESPASPERALPLLKQGNDPAIQSAPPEQPQVTPTRTENSTPAAQPAEESAPTPTRVNPDEKMGPSLYANISGQASTIV